MGRPKIKLNVGDKIESLTVLVPFSGYLINGKRRLTACQCDCGRLNSVITSHLTGPKPSKTCGKCDKIDDFDTSMGHRVYATYKANSLRRNIGLELSISEFLNLINKPCHYCGIPHSNNFKGFKHNGVDRIDNLLPYTLQNSVPCCKFCNMCKHNRSKDEFIEHCRRVASYSGKIP